MSRLSVAHASEVQRRMRHRTKHHVRAGGWGGGGALTVYRQAEVTAVELVLGRHLTSVGSSEVGLGGDDVHLERVDLQPQARGESDFRLGAVNAGPVAVV